MQIAAPAVDQPLTLTLLIALGGSLIGGLFTLAGGWLNARLNRTKDKIERDARWEREDKQRIYTERRQLLIDVAEAVEARKSWLDMIDYGLRHDEAAPLVAPQFQLGARVKLFGSLALNLAWHEFIDHVQAVEMEINLGNMHEGIDTNRTELDNQNACPDAQLHGDVVLALTGILMVDAGSVSHFDLLMMEVESLRAASSDARYAKMRDRWLEKARMKNSPWEMLKPREHEEVESPGARL